MASEGKAWRARIVDRAPLPLLTKPHQVFLAFALFVIGLPLVSGYVRPDSVTSQVPLWMTVLWGWSLFAGSVLTLWGLFMTRPRAEWAGQLLHAYGCTFYVGALMTALPAAAVTMAVFSGLAGLGIWSAFLITSQNYVQHRLARAARDARMKVDRERGA